MADRLPRVGPGLHLPPDETVEFFRAKGIYPISRSWWDLWHEEHARAFTAAKIADRKLLERIRASLDRVLSEGGTFEQWKAGILPQLQAAGWWGVVDNPALTGVDFPVVIGEGRLRIIYDTNLRMARAAGSWKRIQALKGDRPFLQYRAVLDSRTRPQHRAWDGIILPVDHPWWQTHFPPNGWNCRCNVVQLAQRDLDRNGWTVTAEPPEEGSFDFVRGHGIIERVPKGIDPGFGYNVGIEHLRGIALRIDDAEPGVATILTGGATLPPIVPKPLGRLRVLDSMSEQAALDAWDAVVGRDAGQTIVLRDPLGEPVIIDDNFWLGADGRYKIKKRDRDRMLELIADTITDPAEIWYDWEVDDPSRRDPALPPREARIVRRLIGSYASPDGGTADAAIVLETAGGGWRVITSYRINRAINTRRGGHLAYRRNTKEPGR